MTSDTRRGSTTSSWSTCGARPSANGSHASAFDGETAFDIAHAVLHTNPAPLTGSAAIVAADRVIHRALEKDRERRYQQAADMARELRRTLMTSDAATAIKAQQVKRLIVLPFRMLRPDADTAFLSFSLPDAITTSLSGLRTLIVRSTLAGGEFATDHPDLKALAARAEVDLVVLGTLLRGGEQLQVNTQLLEVPQGAVVWSDRAQVAWTDIPASGQPDDAYRRVAVGAAR